MLWTELQWDTTGHLEEVTEQVNFLRGNGLRVGLIYNWLEVMKLCI